MTELKVLLIEDDVDDIELLKEALEHRNIPHSLIVLNDGSAALNYISHGENLPDIIVLDFNLPKVHGRNVIVEFRAANSYKDIPLLILTTSSAKEDIDFSYKNGADKYLIKPVSSEEITHVVDTILRLSGRQPTRKE